MATQTQLAIPAVVDDVKRDPEFPMSRLYYFAVQTDNPPLPPAFIDFIVPFGAANIVWRPDANRGLFDSLHAFNDLLHAVESQTNFDALVVTDSLWMPNAVLFDEFRGYQRGSLFRVGLELFRVAYRFVDDQMTLSEFETACRDLLKQDRDLLRYSADESQALDNWHGEQIDW